MLNYDLKSMNSTTYVSLSDAVHWLKSCLSSGWGDGESGFREVGQHGLDVLMMNLLELSVKMSASAKEL